MRFDWSAECAADDPVLVIPWADPEAPDTIRFVDLRENRDYLDHVPEAEQHPPLLHALRALNGPRSPIFTAKCDAWAGSSEELETLRDDLSLAPELSAAAFLGYIDLLARDRTTFVSFQRHELFLDRLARRAAPLDHAFALLDCVIRPALVDLAGPQEGFAITLYIKATGPDPHSAYANWSSALAEIVPLLRRVELASP